MKAHDSYSRHPRPPPPHSRPASIWPGLAKLGPQHSDQVRDLTGDRLQSGQRGQAAQVRSRRGSTVYCCHRPVQPYRPARLAVLIGDPARVAMTARVGPTVTASSGPTRRSDDALIWPHPALPRSPIVAGAHRTSRSYVLASLWALHLDLRLVASGQAAVEEGSTLGRQLTA